MTRTRRRGFTLVEMLLGGATLGLLITLVTLLTSQNLRLQSRMAIGFNDERSVDSVWTRLRADLRTARAADAPDRVHLRIERADGVVTYEWDDGTIRRTEAGKTTAAYTWQLRRCRPRWVVEGVSDRATLVWMRIDPTVKETAPAEDGAGLVGYAVACRLGPIEEVPQ